MIKRIFWLSLALIAVGVGLTLLRHNIAEAATYNLDYPAGYGCRCAPNWQNYGYNNTQWRQWPGEQRLDIDHPKVIGAEPLPRTKGFEELPKQRVKLQDMKPNNPQPDTGNPSPLPNDQPGGPAVPGGENLPNTQPEPGGFNPMPGLPADPNLNNLGPLDNNKPFELPKETPAPLKNNEKTPADAPSDLKNVPNPAVSGLKHKTESPRKGDLGQPASKRNVETGEMKHNLPTRLPDTKPASPAAEISQSMNTTHPQANENAVSQPNFFADTFRAGIYPATDVASQANYQAPVDPNGNGRLSSEIVKQSFQQPLPPEANPTSMTAESRPNAAPPVALKGYCPVELNRSGRWVQGDPRWTVIHQGFTYRLSGNEQRLQFLANPDRFAPANGGNDPVVSAYENRDVPGDLSYCASFKGKIYMFSSSATQMEFQKNPERVLGVK
jgi:YHS domain-containing protein